MYRLRVETSFAAAHRVVDYSGKCENLHGHTFTVELFVVGKNKEENGMVIDFALLKADLQKVVEKLDHTYLNENTALGNPTSENIAEYIFGEVKKTLLGEPKIEKVRVWEGPRNWVEYLGP